MKWLVWLMLGWSGVAGAAEVHSYPWQMGFLPAVTPVMERIDALHHVLFYVILAVSVFVCFLLMYVCVRFRRSRNAVPSRVTHNTLLEVIWTTIPVLILVAITIPSLRLLYYMDTTPAQADMTLKVVGHQWYWSYEYPDNGDIAFDSYMVKDADLKPGQLRLLQVDEPVVVPVDTTVRVLITGADVIHSWAIPSFGVKTDAVPGRVNETWFRATKPGTYYGQCSELCGPLHGFMPIMVQVVTAEEFKQWVEQKKAMAMAAL